ncbi:MAG: hypothetical protein AB8B91_12395 [Rubripirellula sp.]
MKSPLLLLAVVILGTPLSAVCLGQNRPSVQQLQKLLKQYPAADANDDGVLSGAEAIAYRNKMLGGGRKKTGGVKRDFKVDPGWDLKRFPEHAVGYKTPAEIKQIFAKVTAGKRPAVVSYEKPSDGAVRVVGVGHSFMAPGYRTLPLISKGAGMKQPLYTHVGGGMTGSARYKWEQENGIFQFDGKPVPKLLSSISNAKWDAMMFGPYFNDRAAYYSCWFDFCLKYNPDMKFYLSDAWPQLEQLDEQPTSEAFFTTEVVEQMGAEKRSSYGEILEPLLKAYPGKVFVLPTSDAMVLAAKHYLRGELPGIEGFHRAIGNKERSLWKDRLGHLGPGLERLEGYVFYATLYGRSPEQIEDEIEFGGNAEFPSQELDRMFRKIAWQAVSEHPFTGVSDEDGDGVNDSLKLEVAPAGD